jgi:hypothetical protein
MSGKKSSERREARLEALVSGQVKLKAKDK